jgi:hypothetical protein
MRRCLGGEGQEFCATWQNSPVPMLPPLRGSMDATTPHNPWRQRQWLCAIVATRLVNPLNPWPKWTYSRLAGTLARRHCGHEPEEIYLF